MADRRLSDAIERHMLAPFEWGESDCCLAVCNVLRDLGHDDPAVGFRGRYHDETGARRIIGNTVEDVAWHVCRVRGWPEIDPHDATDGSVGVYGRSLFVHCGGVWFAKSEQGYVTKRRVSRAWRPTR